MKRNQRLDEYVRMLKRVTAQVKREDELPSESRSSVYYQVQGYPSVEEGVIRLFFSQASDDVIAHLQEEVKGYPDDGTLDIFLMTKDERALGVLRYQAEDQLYPVLKSKLLEGE